MHTPPKRALESMPPFSTVKSAISLRNGILVTVKILMKIEVSMTLTRVMMENLFPMPSQAMKRRGTLRTK